MLGLEPHELSYAAGGRRGQELLDQGRPAEAVEAFEAVLAGLGPDRGYGRVVLLERLGRALLHAGEHGRALDRLHEALEAAGRLAPGYEVSRLRAAIRSGLGDALRAGGRTEEARRSYLAALEIARELRDPRGQGVDQARLGALALDRGDVAEALERYRASLAAVQQLKEPAAEAGARHRLGRLYRRLGDPEQAERHLLEAARLQESIGDLGIADRTWTELIELYRESGRLDEAERWCRRAIDGHRRAGPSLRLAGLILTLAESLRTRPGRLEEAGQVAHQALALAQSLEPTAAEVWAAYGLLGEIHPELDGWRELARRAPAVVATARLLGPSPGFGRAVVLGRLGRCFALGRRADLAAGAFGQAATMAGQLMESPEVTDLLGMLCGELGDVLREQGRGEEAARAYTASLRAAERSGDLEGMARNRERLGQGELPPSGVEPADSADPRITVVEETVTDYAFDPNLLLDGPRTRRLVPPTRDTPAPPADTRPMLVPTTRTWLDPEGRIRFSPPASEPAVHVEGSCTVMCRVARDVAVAGEPALVWRLLAAMDGRATWAEIISPLSEAERTRATGIVGELARAGVVDLSDRPLGRFVHWATKKGVIPAGGLEGDEVLRHATDASSRPGADLSCIPVGSAIPERLREFHALTRSRRSSRDYRGGALSREELDGLLTTACGVTGSIHWEGGEVKLRAYPSSGALYSVGICPVVVRVEGLEPAVLRFDAEELALRLVAPLDPERLVGAALPMEREMVAGIAAMICLTGVFPRHERKYGEGGYRMLVAEAGHLSHGLVLAATALGLSVRPFGGVFDGPMNELLQLDERREQFLLAVVIGR